MPTDLTNLADVKAYLHISGTANDSFLSSLITNVSRTIERDCSRVFGADNYVEFQNTQMGQTRAQVINKPIIQMNSVRWGVGTAIQLMYSGSAIFAAAQVTTDRRFVLQAIAPGGTTTNSTFYISSATAGTNTSYATASTLVTAVNAASTGFTATLLGGVDVPTKWFYATAGTPEKTAAAGYTQTINYPNIDVFQYTLDTIYGTLGFSLQSSMDYFFPPFSYSSPSFPPQYQGLCIDYRGGYETIPGDIALLAAMVTADVYKMSYLNGALQSESLGDYSYSTISPLLRRQYYADILAPYKRIAIAGGNG